MQATIFDPRPEEGSCDAVLARGILRLVDERMMVMQRIRELL